MSYSGWVKAMKKTLGIESEKEVDIMKRINKHTLAIIITKKEGGKVSLPIGQVKEVMRLLDLEYKREVSSGNAEGVISAIMSTK